MQQFVLSARKVRFVFQPPDSFPAPDYLAQLDRLYTHIIGYYEPIHEQVLVHLEWQQIHPFMPEVYSEVFRRQQDYFTGIVRIQNTIQTSISGISDELTELCIGGKYFKTLDLMVALDTTPNDETALAEMHRLIALGIDIRGTILLSQDNFAAAERIVRTCAGSGIQSWQLVLEDGLTPAEAMNAMQCAFDTIETESAAISMEPLRTLRRQVLHHHTSSQILRFYNPREWEAAFVIDDSGNLYRSGDLGCRGNACGNVFEQTLKDVLAGQCHQQALDAAEDRMASACTSCRYFGSCDGRPVANLSKHETVECSLIRPLLYYIENRLEQAGAIHPISFEESRSLQRGARIHFLVDEPASRISLSSGTTSAPRSRDARYHTGAIVPNGPWRAPSPIEYRLLTTEAALDSPAPWHFDSDLAVLRIPDQALALLREVCEECGLYGRPGPLNGVPHNRHPRWTSACRTLFAFLKNHQVIDRPMEATTLYVTAPGERTVTKTNRSAIEREAFTGLHLDSWEGVSLRERTKVRNRIGINLGEEDRHFLFVNLTFPQLMQIIGLSDAADIRDVSLFAGHKFLRSVPDYPVVRVRIAPGEAYIAPTGNLIHDADTIGKHLPDVAMHVLGYFAPRELSWIDR